MATQAKLGIIVNPIAGMGGRVGLKGTDSPEVVERARALGAVAESPGRAVHTLKAIAAAHADGLALLAAAGEMGEQEAREAGLEPEVVAVGESHVTTADDTARAAAEMLERGVDLLLFAGGDGTARDIHGAVELQVPVVGVPAGVKMHSAVYATSPRAAADLVVRFLGRDSLPLREAEVMDIDEEAFRQGAVSARLYGYLNVPYAEDLVQGVKAGSLQVGEEAALAELAFEMARRMNNDALYVLGPGTTTRAIAQELGVDKTLLGVDLVKGRRVIEADVTERQILEAIEGQSSRVVVTPIGGQGHIFGRGNQQISAAVIKKVRKSNIIIVATPNKLAGLQLKPLLVDTGDPEVDQMLAGYMRVVTGIRSEAVCRVSA